MNKATEFTVGGTDHCVTAINHINKPEKNKISIKKTNLYFTIFPKPSPTYQFISFQHIFSKFCFLIELLIHLFIYLFTCKY